MTTPYLLFYERFRERARLRRIVDEQSAFIHGALLSSAIEVDNSAIARRRPSISVDGTPVIYSMKFDGRGRLPVLRFLCEPGGLDLTVAQQIDFSRMILRTLTDRLGWNTAQNAADTILDRVIPANPASLSDWWGGLWLGMVARLDGTEIRLYANLRHGDIVARWQRVANLLAPFADERLIEPVRNWIARSGRVAIPVGVGLVLTPAGMPVVRVYLGVERPDINSVRAARPEQFRECNSTLADFCSAYANAYGSFSRQSMTLGFDFCRGDDGLFEAQIARFKVDVSLEHIDANSQCPPASFVSEQIGRAFPGEARSWMSFCDDLVKCFGSFDIQYVSLGMRAHRLTEITTYVKPRLPMR